MPQRCALCEEDGGIVVWRDAHCRVVRPEVEGYPAFLRVVLGRHAAEMTDLEPAERDRLMRVVFATERVLREVCRPDKVNLASLGNQVPHLHWHVIPRHRDDPHFPEPVWGARQRTGAARTRVEDARLGARLSELLG
ncbi:MAG: HIT family protein [Burkholderiales bacterium]|nr:HIT family protein [Burkholderiales bacterium]